MNICRTHSHKHLRVDIYVYTLKITCSHRYLKFQSNTTEFILVFSTIRNLLPSSLYIYWFYQPHLCNLPHMVAAIPSSHGCPHHPTWVITQLSLQHLRQGCLSTWTPSSACSDPDSLFQDSPHHGDPFQPFQVLIQHASHHSYRCPHCPNWALIPHKDSLLTQSSCQHSGPGHLPQRRTPYPA